MSVDTEPTEPFNYFLAGNFAPVRDEHTSPDLEAIGAIPADLKGHFLRIGPNPYYIPNVEKYHLFDGDGMLHQVQFENGKATYRNKFVDSAGLRAERKKGTWIWRGMGEMADVIASGEIPEEGMSKNLANTAVVFHNKTLYALVESDKPHIIDLPSINTVGETDFDGGLTHAFTAHPKVDVKTGEMMTFGYSPFPPYLTYSVVDKDSKFVHTAPIDLPKGVMMHDCAITEKHTIFLDLPVTFDVERGMSGGDMMAWEPENGSRIGIVQRMGNNADVKWFDIRTAMIFHVANAWEDGDEVVMQASRSDYTDITGVQEMAVANEGGSASDHLGLLYEYRFNMKTGTSTERCMDKTGAHHCDFTRINDDYVGYKNRYVYAACFCLPRPNMFHELIKYDDVSGDIQVHNFGDGVFGGEAIFAPRDGSSSEDDGYVICFTYDENTEQSECRVIDAQNFDGPPVARIQIPSRVPFGFHAGWAPAL